jgi:hypothetical protein
MAANTATIGYGAALAYSDTENGSYTSVSEVLDMEIPRFTQDTVEATHMESPNNFIERIAALKDPGEYTFTINFNKTQYDTLDGLAGTTKWWRVQTPADDTWKFQGFISEIGGEMPLNDRITAEIVITITGAITYTPSA